MTDHLPRLKHEKQIAGLLERFPVVAIVGARQVGKTSLARMLAKREPGPVHTFDLEDPADLARLSEPGLALRRLEGLVVIDEVQHRPDLFPLLRVLADRADTPARFLVLGSASPELLRQGAESLAGRIAYHRLSGFGLDEVGTEAMEKLWIRGGFPRSFLAGDDTASYEWRAQFSSTFILRDVPSFGVGVPGPTMRRFWTMLAHFHGQLWNASELGRSFGVADTTVRRYLDVLSATYMIRQLQPWHANVRKRQVKSPKIYFEDTGLLHTLLGLVEQVDVERHPKLGASWEGFALHQVIARLGANEDECFFWATHGGAELDLLVVRGQRRLGFEFKRTEAPKVTKSMRIAISDLELECIDVVHAGSITYPLTEGVRALALVDLVGALAPL